MLIVSGLMGGILGSWISALGNGSTWLGLDGELGLYVGFGGGLGIMCDVLRENKSLLVKFCVGDVCVDLWKVWKSF